MCERGRPACIDRRRFLVDGSVAAAAALLAACGDGQIGNTVTGVGGPTRTTTVRLADYPTLGTVGGVVRLDGTSRPVAVVRSGSTSYRAFSLVCPHQGSTVGIVGGASFQCPNHGARFSASGQWTGGERTGNLTELQLVADDAAGTLTITY